MQMVIGMMGSGIGCAWTAASSSANVNLSPQAGTGNGTVTFIAGPNLAASAVTSPKVSRPSSMSCVMAAADECTPPAASGAGQAAIVTSRAAPSRRVRACAYLMRRRSSGVSTTSVAALENTRFASRWRPAL